MYFCKLSALASQRTSRNAVRLLVCRACGRRRVEKAPLASRPPLCNEVISRKGKPTAEILAAAGRFQTDFCCMENGGRCAILWVRATFADQTSRAARRPGAKIESEREKPTWMIFGEASCSGGLAAASSRLQTNNFGRKRELPKIRPADRPIHRSSSFFLFLL